MRKPSMMCRWFNPQSGILLLAIQKQYYYLMLGEVQAKC